MSSSDLSISPVELGEIFARSKDAILGRFVDRVRTEVRGASGESRSYLEDHLGEIIDEIAAYLTTYGNRTDLEAIVVLSKTHGLQRAAGAHYTVEDLRHEYRILRSILFAFIPSGRLFSLDTSAMFGDVYDLCVSRGTEVFVRNSAAELAEHRQLLSTHEALRESEAELKFTLATTRLGTWSVDIANGGTVTLSDEATAIMGIALDHPSAQAAINTAIHPADRDAVARALTNTATTGAPYKLEYRVVRADGSVRWVDSRGRAVYDGAGTLRRISGVLIDITERKGIDEHLLTSKRLLELAAAGGRVGFWNLDVERGTMEMDETMASDWGIDPATFPGTVDATFERVHPDDVAYLRQEMATAQANRSPYAAEHRVVRPSGAVRWIRANGEFYEDSNRKLVLFRGVSIDITDRKLGELAEQQTAAAVADERRKLEEVLEQTSVPTVLLLGEEHVYSFANTAYRRTFAIDPDPIGRPVRDVLPDAVEQGFGALLTRVYRTGEPFSGSDVLYERILPDGTSAPIYVDFTYAAKRNRDNEIEGVLATIVDVTERRRSSEQLKAATLEAQNANVAKSAFLANMSHEIRTPLGAIMGFSELLKNPEITSEETSHFIAIIERNSQHVLRIVDDILDLSKVEAGKMLFERIEFSLTELLSDFASLMAFRAREKGVEFLLHFDSAIPDFVLSDPTRLRQILSNVVGNAIKFTERGMVEMAVRFDDGMLTFAVKDTGRGLSPEQADKLFQAFVQADESTTRKYGGTGLGLVLTKRLSTAMGGDFVLGRSEPGVGSTFVASLRVDVPAHAVISRHATRHASVDKSRPGDKARLAGLRILVVEDSPDNRTLLGVFLRKAGASVDFANDGQEGVEKALAARHDAVVMDIQMPRLDGYQALEKLQQQRYATPVIALTAHAMVEERTRAESKGFAAFLTKPVQSELLLEALDGVKSSKEKTLPSPKRATGVVAVGKRVLLVEDDDDSRFFLDGFIRKRGFDVTCATSGEHALQLLREGPVPDLVLLDLTLPDITGEEVLKFIRATPRIAAAKVVVVSGWDNLEERARELGADEALQKPVEFPRLRQLLDRAAKEPAS